jgi:lipopolysaccharide/colanic/teichoic acid biosynthesis glycosyltransferase
VTRIGQFLRRTSLDETPQIWNVLRGEMTLVGPRPTSFDASTYALWHTERLDVVPGLTGLWQIERRGDIDFDDRVRLDIAYVRQRSLRLDLEILLRTLPAVLSQRGAY